MAKIPKAPVPMPTTPEELMALSQQAAPAAPPKASLHQTIGQLPAKGVTPVPQVLQGPQGELLTGMAPKVPTGPQTEIPLEMRGAQGELVTQQPAAATPPPAPVAPIAPAPPEAPAAGKKPMPDISDALARMVAQKTTRPEAPEAKKPKGEFWKKLGTLAKNTGRTVAELLQAGLFGYTGNQQPLQYQIRQAGEREAAAKEGDRAFQERMAQINREWQAAQYQTRDAAELERERMRLESEAQQAALNRQSSEKIAGLRVGGEGAVPGEDPVQAWLRKTFGGGK